MSSITHNNYIKFKVKSWTQIPDTPDNSKCQIAEYKPHRIHM